MVVQVLILAQIDVIWHSKVFNQISNNYVVEIRRNNKIGAVMRLVVKLGK